MLMSKVRVSPHYRAYGQGITITPSKTDYSVQTVTPEAEEMIRVLEYYVEWDDGAFGKPLCMRSLCVKGEGHVGACRKAK